MRDVLQVAADLDPSQTPPQLTRHVQRRIRKLTDADDACRELKQRANQVVLAALPKAAAEATRLRLAPCISHSAAA